jgi:regulator of sigma E protease
VILAVDGEEIVQREQLFELIRLSKGRTLEFTVLRDGEETQLEITPARPASSDSTAKDKPLDYMIGATFQAPQPVVREWRRPGPFKQVGDTLRTMWITLTTVASPDSDIGIQHLSGPVGIGKIQYFSLLLDNPFHRILTFMVLINVNLALLNLLPFPVLDGGHITIATMEAIARRPVNVRFLEVLQLAFVFLLFGIMLYVTSKDVVDDFGMGSRDEPAPIVFPKPDSVRGESDAPE